jgi:MFS family permease
MTNSALPRKIWIALILLGFSGQLAWGVENQFFNTFVYDNITPDPRPISWMVAASAITATLTSIFMGALSDRLRTRWGKRKPLIILGYIMWGVLTILFPTAAFLKPISVAIGMAILYDCLMTFFGSTANDAALNAYITDVTSDENRGRVVGVMQIMTWVAILIVYGGAGPIIQVFGYYTFFYAIGGLVLLMGVIGSLMVQELPDNSRPVGSYWGQIREAFQWKTLRDNGNLFLLLVAMAVYGIAENIFFPYLMIYLNHHIQLPTMQASILIFLAILVGGIGLAYPIGVLTDKWGRKKVAYLALVVKMAGLVLFSLAASFVPLVVTGIMFLAGMSAWLISTGAWSKDLFPENMRGQFAGFVILFTVAFAMVPGPLIGSWLSTNFGTPITINGQAGFIPSPVVFQVAGVATLLAGLPLFWVKKG